MSWRRGADSVLLFANMEMRLVRAGWTAGRVSSAGDAATGALVEGQRALRLQEQLLDGDASSLLIGRIDDAGVPGLTLYRVGRVAP
jgi:hypothetical protein